MTTKPIYFSGLMRCCIATWEEYTGPEDEGQTLACKYEHPEHTTMVVKNGYWQWVGPDYNKDVENENE